MSNVKELKSIDLSSYTIIATGISVLFAILLSIILSILIVIVSPASIGVIIYIIPTIVVGAFILGIYNYFSQGLFYNFLASKLRNIYFEINDNEIVKISTTETATLIATITVIQAIIIYLVSLFILPITLYATIQTLMFGGQQMLAYTLYQFMAIISQPMTIIMFIFGSFVITFVFVLIGTYIYNLLASKGKGIVVELSEENNLTVVDSIDMMKFAIVSAIISGLLSIITAIIMLISGGTVVTLISNVISGFVSGFIGAALVAIFYNFLAPKIGKLKIELIDQ